LNSFGFIKDWVEKKTRRLMVRARNRTSDRHSLVGPGNLWEMKRAFQIHFLQSVGLTPDQYLLDIGCGTLRGGIPIIKYLEEGHYYGIESRELVLQEGRQELIDCGLEDRSPHLLHIGDLQCQYLGKSFDIIWAFSVLIHMTDDILNEALFFVKRHLTSDGSFYANVNVGERQQDGTWESFPHVYRSVNFYEQACLKAGLSLKVMGALRDFGHISGVASQDAQRMLHIRQNQ
jgi:cyclopropane fatty-acyl-phospholipid synthase-like methyltransferase